MNTTFNFIYSLLLFFLLPFTTVAQDDLDSLLNENVEEKVIATFKTSRIVNAHSLETVKKKTMDFRITHHFGNIGGNAGGGHTFFGLDEAADIRIALEYGINDRFTVGLGRSKINELIDGFLKYRLLWQTEQNSMPLSLTLLINSGFSPAKNTDGSFDKFSSRFSYTYQAIIGRKFSKRLSLQIAPTFLHRNYIYDAADEHDLFSLSAGGRFKITRKFAVVADYFYTFSQYRRDHSNLFSDPLGVGVELETGGHVFHVFLTNNAAITENNFIPYTSSFWKDGEFKLGFTISRVF